MRNQRANAKPVDVDFNNVLKQFGVTDLNKLIGGVTSGSEDEKSKKRRAE